MEGVRNSKSFVMPFSDILKLLRIPFSVFLLPVFLFPLLTEESISVMHVILLFIILHFFIYPASNSYNSFMDQDTGSIGGLEKPPVAGMELYYASLFLDLFALVIAAFISYELVAMLLLYSVVSRLYSWRKVRIKKYPWTSLVVVSLMQGGYTYMICSMFFTNETDLNWFAHRSHWFGFAATTFMVSALYPLTQIYQHKDDIANGDRTVSYVLGINGTFLISGLFFLLSCLSVWLYFDSIDQASLAAIFGIFLIPVIFYFLRWALRCRRNYREANFSNTMKMNKISSLMLIAAFVVIRLAMGWAVGSGQ